MLNRAAILIKYKQPALDWLNNAEPEAEGIITLESVNSDRTVYLVREEAYDDTELFLKENYRYFFENELFSWYTAEELWPEKLSLELFSKWFEVECHSMVLDAEEEELADDEI
ncbi:MAG: hypothetical protein PQJ50_15745 [Spirochaetales bacterium]|nr:hypothetical protein [Spirochaetales bacterium]